MTTTKHEDTRTGEASTATDGAATASTNGKAWTMAMEAFNDQLSRVEQMGEDHNGAWDLSDNDTAAIRAVLEDRLRLWAALQSIAANSCCGPCREAGMFAAAALRDTPAVPAGATPPVAIRAGSAQDSSSSSSALASSPPASPHSTVENDICAEHKGIGGSPDCDLCFRENYEAIGRDLCRVIKRLMPDYSYADCPTEVVGDLLSQIDELEGVASPPASAPPSLDVHSALEWIAHLATPPRPTPSAWTEIDWLNHWRAQRSAVIRTLAAATGNAPASAPQGDTHDTTNETKP